MEIIGKIIEIQDVKQVSAKYRLRPLIIETTEERFPQIFQIDFAQDKVGLLDKWRVGQTVAVGINLQGRRWQSPKGETKYFTSIKGWRIQESDEPETGYPTDGPSSSDDDDIPF